MSLTITINYDSSISNLNNSGSSSYNPTLYADITGAIQSAVQFYENAFTNPLTVSIDFGWGEVGGDSIPTGAVAASESSVANYHYSQVYSAYSALASAGTASTVQTTAFSTLPATDPTNNGTFQLTTAEARALGLSGANVTPDGWVGLDSTTNWSWSQANVAPNTFDAVGAFEHEISEVLGRLADGGNDYTLLDMFRYTAANNASGDPPGSAAGPRDEPFVRGYSVAASSYFSYNGKTVTLQFETPADVGGGADIGDWAPSVPNDSYADGGADGADVVSPTDLEEMNVLGWDLATNPCYCAGTLIATERGDVVVEDLVIGDRVLTLDGELRAIKWIGRRSYRHPFIARSVMPILIKAGALRENVPLRDLYVSPEHAMYIDEVLVPATHLVNGVSVLRCANVATVQYFHIELDSHDVIFAEGAPAETFVACGNRLMFHNAAEFAKLYPGDSSPSWAYCAPRVDSGPILEQIQRAIADRAGLPALDDAAVCGPLEGHFDDAGHTLINGWAFDPTQPHTPVWLEVLVNDGVIGRVLADKYRPDAAQSGKGDGYHGFALWLQQGLSPLSRHVIRVRRVADGCELPGSPRVLEARGVPDLLRSAELVPVLREAALGAADDEMLDQILGALRRGINEVRQVRAERQSSSVESGVPGRLLRRSNDGAVKARRALVIDDRLPNAARDAGSNAVLGHMRALMGLGYRVEFVPAQQSGKDVVPSDPDLCAVRWHRAPAVTSVEDVLRRNADRYDVIYLHRLSNASAYAGLARQWCPQAHLVYSVADLHHVRLTRQAQVHDLPQLRARAERVKQFELHAMRGVDAVITHSRAEAEYLAAEAPDVHVRVVPWPLAPIACNMQFMARDGLAFIGSVAHDPNVDAVVWLVREIMPRVWRRDPSITCRIVGAGWPAVLRGYLDRRVRLVGAVPELVTVFDQVRLSVAPLRFGSGIKGKVLDSLAAGVPCVMTPIAAEGLALPPSLRGLVSEDPDQLANLIWRLHKDAHLNAKVATIGLDLIAREFRVDHVRSALQTALPRTELPRVRPVRSDRITKIAAAA